LISTIRPTKKVFEKLYVFLNDTGLEVLCYETTTKQRITQHSDPSVFSADYFAHFHTKRNIVDAEVIISKVLQD
jgi:hypothetical protein